MLRNDFKLKLPDFPENGDWLPSEYFATVARAVSSQPRWRVQANEVVLGFYSFAKFLMWRDLAPENEWGAEGGMAGNRLVEGRFLLAVECDGARYHSSSWARERDRLRQAVLEQKGWTFHRIWSTDWFYNRDVELRKLLEAVEQARTVRDPMPAPATDRTRPPVEREVRALEPEIERVPYREASLAIHEILPLHEVPRATVARYVVQIVEVEGPVHLEEVGRRLSRLWGYKCAGSRIQDSVRRAVSVAVRSGSLRYSGTSAGAFLEPASEPSTDSRPSVPTRSLFGFAVSAPASQSASGGKYSSPTVRPPLPFGRFSRPDRASRAIWIALRRVSVERTPT